MGSFIRAVMTPMSTMSTNIRVLNIVVLVSAILSMVGAGCMILSFILFRSLRTFRHQVILGLAISDFILAINFVVSSSVNLSGHLSSKALCNFNGYITQLFVIQSDYWIFIIALYTFLLLGDYKHQTRWLQLHRWAVWVVPWLLSTLWASLGLGLVGYGDVGAWHWFTSDKVQLLANFLPRWIIIFAIFGMYGRLCFVLYRTHSQFGYFSDKSSISFEDLAQSVSERETAAAEDIESASTGKKDGVAITVCEVSCSENVAAPRKASVSSSLRQSGKLKIIAYQMVAYPLVFLFMWSVPTIVTVYQVTRGQSAPFVVDAISHACIAAFGLINALVYGCNESSLVTWRNALFPPQLKSQDISNEFGPWQIDSTGHWVRLENFTLASPPRNDSLGPDGSFSLTQASPLESRVKDDSHISPKNLAS